MSEKSIISLGMLIGSVAGGYIPVLFGASGLSFASLTGSTIGALIGVYAAFRFVRS